jgi:inorganic triphosphatase YgiF
MPDEVEGKLILTSPDRAATIEAIAALDAIGGYTVARRSEHALSDAYFDTPSRDLQAVRLALRVRGDDGRDRLTVKGEGRIEAGVVSRYELERDWSPEALDEVLAVLRDGGVNVDTSRLDTRGGAMNALQSLGFQPTSPRTNRRTALALASTSGEVLAELDVDRVTFKAGDRSVHHYEVECEAHGDHGNALIRAVLADLRARFEGLHPVSYSKLDLAEHVERLAAERRLVPMLYKDALTAEAYAEIQAVLRPT